ncbi:MAG TPA: UbiA family prenyltransferase [Planctomycetota bacterium]|nr:UbiA family prenyltransferase [Planctomycetota bacterium]
MPAETHAELTHKTSESTKLPLCVDLDGTLLKTDSLVEMTFSALKQRPFLLLRLPALICSGKAALKHEIASLSKLDPAKLPLNEELLAFLKRERSAGRYLVLATGANRSIAERINARLGLFDEIIASDCTQNVCGEVKRDELVRRFGAQGFAYAGNSSADHPVWAAAGEAIVVNAKRSVERKARRDANVSMVVSSKPSSFRILLKAMRVHQWSKNLLVFVPLIAAHQVLNADAWLSSLLLFAAFGLCASAGYLINDLLDIDADRLHPTKRHRPIASGAMPIHHALFLAPALLLMAAALSTGLTITCQSLLAVYFLVSMLYSMYLKRKLLIDVYCLAGLYTLRVLAGGEACEIECSKWLLSFSAFLFISLAFLKRFSELNASDESHNAENRRGYRREDTIGVAALGICSGLVCALVLALYISSADVQGLYVESDLLWLVCPLLLYWISRVWLIAFRGKMTSDPVVFALTDRISYAVASIIALIIFGAAKVELS